MGIERFRDKKNKFMLILLTFFFLILCVGVSAGASLYNYLSGFSKKLNNDPNAVKPYAAKSKYDPINVLIMGVDMGTLGAKEENNHRRTDTIMVMNYNPKSEEVNVVSIPRDTLILVKGKNQKINAANAIGGVQYLIDAVEQLLDIKINYYGKVDYSGFREFVNIVGGVDMIIPNRMDYDDSAQNLHIHFKKDEIVHLDGKKAEEFFRWRKNNDGTGLADGDLGRIENQHAFISKMMEKLKSVTIIPKIPEILDAIPKYAETNMDADSILKYGRAILTVNKDKIKMYTVQGDLANIDSLSYVIYDEKKNDNILSILHDGTKVEADSKLQREKLNVQLLNCTKQNGLAGNLSANLRGIGYANINAANGSRTSKTVVNIYGLDKKFVDTIKSDLGVTNIVYNEEKTGNYDIVVLIGDDYKGK